MLQVEENNPSQQDSVSQSIRTESHHDLVDNLLTMPLNSQIEKRSQTLNEKALEANQQDTQQDTESKQSPIGVQSLQVKEVRETKDLSSSESGPVGETVKRKSIPNDKIKDLIDKLWPNFDTDNSGVVDKIEAQNFVN